MRLYFRILYTVTAVAAAVAALCSCSSEIALGEDDFDAGITVGGEAFAMPLGSTDTVSIGDFLELSEGDVIGIDENGNYFIQFLQNFNEKVSLSDFTEQLTVEGLEHEISPVSTILPDAGDIPETGLGGNLIMIDLGLDEQFAYEFGFEEARGHGLVSISRVELADTYLQPVVELVCGSPLPESLEMEVQVVVPDRYVFEESAMLEGNTVTFSGTVDRSGHVYFEPLTLTAIEFEVPEDGSEQPFVFSDEFTVRNFHLYFDPQDLESLSGEELAAYMTVSVRGGSADGSLVPEAFLGRVDVDVDPVNESVTLEGIPDMFKAEDVALDFYNPYITAELNTNSGVSVNINADLVPVFAEGEGDALHLELETPVSDDPGESAGAFYWISTERPAGLESGYTWIEADMRNFIKRIPDAVDIRIVSNTDPGEDAYIVCEGEYSVDGEFVFNLPFSFGESLRVPVRDTLTGMPVLLSDLVRSANVTISGELTSTIPLGIKLTAYFLDSGMRRLEIPDVEQMVNSAGAGSAPAVTELELTVPKTDIQEDIYALVFQFELLAGEVPGEPLSSDAYIRANLSLEVPGGITLDINDINNESNY